MEKNNNEKWNLHRGAIMKDNNAIGIQYLQEGKYELAIKAFTEEIENNPTNAVAYVNFGNVLNAVGEKEKAMNFYKKALGLDEKMAAAYYALGNNYFELEDWQNAKEMFEAAMKNGLQNDGDTLFMLGMTLLKFDQPKLALPYFQRAVELKPTDMEARFQYGLCLAQQGLLEEAIEQLEEVVKHDKQHADAFYNLGVAYAYTENKEKSLEMLDKALEVQHDHILAAHAKKIILEN